MKRMLILVMVLSFSMLNAQETEKKANDKTDVKKDKKEEVRKTFQKVYQETVLEDFESSEYTEKNLIFRKTTKQKGSISVRDQYPAPFNNSKKYLGIKVYGKSGYVFRITPAKPLTINKYARSISVWVYGKKFSGQLDLWIKDAKGRNHRLRFGKTSFLGWKKLTVRLPRKIKQQDEYLEQAKKLEILYFQYRPGNRTIHPIWHYFYMDDVTAKVRDKYKDRQSDDW